MITFNNGLKNVRELSFLKLETLMVEPQRQIICRAATIFLLFDSMQFDFLPLRFDYFDSIHWLDEKQ